MLTHVDESGKELRNNHCYYPVGQAAEVSLLKPRSLLGHAVCGCWLCVNGTLDRRSQDVNNDYMQLNMCSSIGADKQPAGKHTERQVCVTIP